MLFFLKYQFSLCSILYELRPPIFTMSKQDFRQIYFYEFKLGRSAAQTARNINVVWGEGSISECTVQRWFQKFRVGDFDLEDKEGRGRPSVVDHDHLRALVEDNPRKTTRDFAREVSVDHSTVVRHLEQIGKVKKLDTWVPHELTQSQKHRRFEICNSLLLRYQNEPFLNRIVTCDEKWIQYDNRRRSGQWLDKDEAPKHFAKPSLHPKKVMVTVWWSTAGVIHYSFLNTGETITAETYCQEIDKMHRKLQNLCPALVNRKGPILLHDNARPHIAMPTLRKLQELKYETLPHPPYSPDLSPTDFHLFRHLDNFLRGKNFRDRSETENAFREFIESLNKDFLETGIRMLLTRWQLCVDNDGTYFE